MSTIIRGRGGPWGAALVAGVTGLALSLVLSLPGLASAAPGDLDPTFGGDGKVTVDVANAEGNTDVVVQADGKIIMLGSGSDFESPYDFILVRHNADGSRDTTFGGDGVVFTDFGEGTQDEARALMLDGRGKIVAVGSSAAIDGPSQVALASYNLDGSLDTTFSDDGKLVTGLGETAASVANTVIAGTDNRIIIGGSLGGNAMVAGFTPTGVSESPWGDDGSGKTVFTYAGGNSAVYDLTPSGGGLYLAAGRSPAGFGLMRFDQEFGATDAGFGDNGKVATPFGNEIVSIEQVVGGFVAAGSSGSGTGSRFAVARYDGDGTLDPAFGGGDGTVTTAFGANSAIAHDMALQEDEKIVVVGGAALDFAVARYNTDGSLDTTFHGDGLVTTDISTFFDEAYAVALQTDGKIVVSGQDGDNQAVVRYQVAGTPPPPTVDLSVAKTGSTTVSLGDQATYTITVTNTSTTTTATGVLVADSITGGSGTMIAATPSQGGPCTLTATTATCPLGTIAPGASASFTLRVEPRATGTLWDGAAIGAVDQDDTDPSDDSRVFATTVNNARGCTIVGTSGFETINGTFGNDVICALSGHDTVNAGGGSDTVYAGPGNDLVNGGNGNDRLIGQTGNDRLNGDAGNDNLDARDGVASNDAAYGGFGFDTCSTDPGDFRNSCP
ncbi:calcium-binding protein [Streptomyces sp. NPDC048604]|uniref:calcium-binding protein n=1 Tax=Streptomyces sp. NPDC048604 TaxID=3365578 RepID=UPI00372258A5